MNKENFMEQLRHNKNMKAPEGIEKLSAKDYFETETGTQMIRFIAENVEFTSEREFTIFNCGVTETINSHPLYKGRNFFDDMQELGFERQVVDYKYDVVEVETLLFKI